jgi:hypothetical protein
VNCIHWSWDCTQIANYPLGDSSIIYGAHRYGNGSQAFSAAELARCDVAWANWASTYPVIVDEVGLYNPPQSPVVWGVGFLTYTALWVQTRGGSGVIGFNDAWSDPNSMTNWDGTWNAWGQAFITYFWSKV